MADKEAQEKMEVVNKWPISRKAREMLEQVGETPPDGAFSCSLLALWGVEKGGVEMDAAVCETVRAMVDWRLERVFNFLMLTEEGAYEPAGWEQARDPQELAEVILNDIEVKMLKHFPFCGSAE